MATIGSIFLSSDGSRPVCAEAFYATARLTSLEQDLSQDVVAAADVSRLLRQDIFQQATPAKLTEQTTEAVEARGL